MTKNIYCVHMAARSSPERSPAVLRANELAGLQKGRSIFYMISSFPALTVLLLSVKLQWENNRGVVHLFDSYMRECGLLTQPLPLVAAGCIDTNILLCLGITQTLQDLFLKPCSWTLSRKRQTSNEDSTSTLSMSYGSFLPCLTGSLTNRRFPRTLLCSSGSAVCHSPRGWMGLSVYLESALLELSNDP